MAGRISGQAAVATYCECGLAFAAWTAYPMSDLERGRQVYRDAITEADRKWQAHVREVEGP